jgi:hypothetical protein
VLAVGRDGDVLSRSLISAGFFDEGLLVPDHGA